MKIEFEIPDRYAPVDGVAVLRVMDEEGGEEFQIAEYGEPSPVVRLGLLRSALVLDEAGIWTTDD